MYFMCSSFSSFAILLLLSLLLLFLLFHVENFQRKVVFSMCSRDMFVLNKEKYSLGVIRCEWQILK